MEYDAGKEIRRAVDTGKVLFGEKESKKSVLNGNGEIIIVSSNLSSSKKEQLQYFAKLASIAYFEFDGTGTKLGSVCGKPFAISTMVIQDTGKSSILKAVTETATQKPTAKKKAVRKK
ncbi:MAG: 50S ribosomal protein L30e [Candidatus Diapherotrites archaeon]|nr:50S ribosomal protein L30e [Candidatus Diapherotrites archaeon]